MLVIQQNRGHFWEKVHIKVYRNRKLIPRDNVLFVDILCDIVYLAVNIQHATNNMYNMPLKQ